MTQRFIRFLLAFIAWGAGTLGVALAGEAYPTRPITLIVPFAAGGAVDIVGRLAGEQLSQALGQPVVVENVTGAGGTIAATRVARAAPDGYTILVGNLGTQVASVGSFKKLAYDPRVDFTPIILLANAPEVLLVGKDAPPNSLQEFVSYLKSVGRPITIGHSGVGSTSYLTYLLFRKLSGTAPVSVPYRGDIEADRDVMSGRVDAVFNWSILAAPYVTSKQLKAMVVLAPQRSAVMPDVPSAAEAGMPNLLVNAWTALFFPKDTPQPIVERVNAALQKAFANEAVVARMTKIGLDIPTPEQRTPQALHALVESELDKWLPLIQAATN
ncbi:MAG TPA: tripartite tricarboxylate transporter substrate binding protein [Pseudolabrys sp.]|nr:tripartite tricarboxylate transporter substrate binding protein [Pseudolabrys sp.]